MKQIICSLLFILFSVTAICQKNDKPRLTAHNDMGTVAYDYQADESDDDSDPEPYSYPEDEGPSEASDDEDDE